MKDPEKAGDKGNEFIWYNMVLVEPFFFKDLSAAVTERLLWTLYYFLG